MRGGPLPLPPNPELPPLGCPLVAAVEPNRGVHGGAALVEGAAAADSVPPIGPPAPAPSGEEEDGGDPGWPEEPPDAAPVRLSRYDLPMLWKELAWGEGTVQTW